MTTDGKVNGRKATVPLSVKPRRSEDQIECEAIIDTGFEGGIALPVRLMAGVPFEPLNVMPIALADGTQREFNTYSGIATVGGIEQPVAIIALPEGLPLIGTVFLEEKLTRTQFELRG